jgi:hypothetical protein
LKIASDTYLMASRVARVTYQQLFARRSFARNEQRIQRCITGFRESRHFLARHSHDSQLPETVGSLPGVPAQVTIPIACGKPVPAT